MVNPQIRWNYFLVKIKQVFICYAVQIFLGSMIHFAKTQQTEIDYLNCIGSFFNPSTYQFALFQVLEYNVLRKHVFLLKIIFQKSVTLNVDLGCRICYLPAEIIPTEPARVIPGRER